MFNYNYTNPYPMPQNKPIMGSQQQSQNIQIPFQDVRFINEEEFNSFMVLIPNSRALLIDPQKSVACIKSTDGLGLSYIERYSFNKINDVKETQPNQTNYATKDELKSLADKLAELQKRLQPADTEKVEGE